MHHGQMSSATSRKLKRLREQIKEAEIPPGKLDESLIIGTWNIREFGKVSRRDASIQLQYILSLKLLGSVLALTELRDNLDDLKRVLNIHGLYYKVVFSDFRSDSADFQERIAYVYDKRAAVFTGLAAEADPLRESKSQGS